jgi:large subunit ribosomal protein L25
VSVQDAEIGTRILASDVSLPPGVELRTDPEQLVVNVLAAPTAEDMGTETSDEDEAAPAAGTPDEPA